jgi:hypothetical protein
MREVEYYKIAITKHYTKTRQKTICWFGLYNLLKAGKDKFSLNKDCGYIAAIKNGHINIIRCYNRYLPINDQLNDKVIRTSLMYRQKRLFVHLVQYPNINVYDFITTFPGGNLYAFLFLSQCILEDGLATPNIISYIIKRLPQYYQIDNHKVLRLLLKNAHYDDLFELLTLTPYHPDIVQKILRLKVEIPTPNTLIRELCQSSIPPKTLELVLKYGVQLVDDQFLLGDTVRYPDKLKLLLQYTNLNVNENNGYALELASSVYSRSVKILLEHGADVSIDCNRALFNAVVADNIHSIKLLLQYGANPYAKNHQGKLWILKHVNILSDVYRLLTANSTLWTRIKAFLT